MSGRRFIVVVSVPLVLALVAVLLQGLDGRSFLRDSEALGALAFVGFGVVGALIVGRDRRHPLGWLFYGSGTIAVIAWSSDNYARYSIRNGLDLPGELLAAWIQNWAWFLGAGIIFTLGLLLFPDGRLPGRRWRPAAWLAATSLVGITIAFMLNDEALDGFPQLPNPTGVIPEGAPVAGFFFVGVLISALVCLLSVGIRFKRSSGRLRQQMKWVVYAVFIMALANLALPVLGVVVPETTTDIIFGISTLLFPVACGIAILRYRLYDIDLIVNRTLVYGGLTAILGAAYLGVVVLLQRLLAPLAATSDLAVAGSTLLVAGLFRPLRARVQAFIDQRFYRRKYDAAETLRAFSSRLRDQVDLDSLRDQLVGVVGETMHPDHVSLWLRETDESS